MIRLRELRKSKKLSQQAVANMLGVTQATLSGWETEKYEIDNQSLSKLASFFDTTIDYILGRTDKKTPAPEIRDGKEENNTPLVYGYEEPEILPTISESKHMIDKSNDSLDDMEKTLLELFRSMSMVEKCKLITEIEEKRK